MPLCNHEEKEILEVLKNKFFVPEGYLAGISLRYMEYIKNLNSKGWKIKKGFEGGVRGYYLANTNPNRREG